jgi:alpha 1,2-mannosyltransferase
MSAEAVQVFNDLDVTVLDIYHSLEGVDAELPLRGFQIKAFAVLHSTFEQVLWLDSDAVPATNVTRIFSSETLNTHGSLFWQDWSRDPHWLTPQFMAVYGLHMHEGERELEAGQFVLWKRRTWHALQLVLYMNRNFPHFYRRLYGDKGNVLLMCC